jgi:hypothetical protein
LPSICWDRPLGRAQLWLSALGHLASMAFITVIAWQLAKYASDVQQSGQTTWVLRWSLAPWWWAASALAALTVPVQFIVTLRAISNAVAGAPAAADKKGGGHA